jgi:hypothetical protein
MRLAHAFLIYKRFLKPSQSVFHVDARIAAEWTAALQEPLANAVQRLKTDGLITAAYAEPYAPAAFHAHALSFLHHLTDTTKPGVPEGRTEKVDRLLKEQPERMTALLRDLDICAVSDSGRLFAQTYINRHRLAQQAAIEAFMKVAIPAMMKAADSLREDLGFPFGTPLPQARPALWFKLLATSSPAVLAPLPHYLREELRRELAIESLVGRLRQEETAKEWTLSESGFVPFQREFARNMLESAATNLHKLLSFRRINVKQVRITRGAVIFGLKSHPPCGSCLAMENTLWPTDSAPELPHPACTHPHGCRCSFSPSNLLLN